MSQLLFVRHSVELIANTSYNYTVSLPNLLVTSTFQSEQTKGSVTFPNAYPRKMTASVVEEKEKLQHLFFNNYQQVIFLFTVHIFFETTRGSKVARCCSAFGYVLTEANISSSSELVTLRPPTNKQRTNEPTGPWSRTSRLTASAGASNHSPLWKSFPGWRMSWTGRSVPLSLCLVFSRSIVPSYKLLHISHVTSFTRSSTGKQQRGRLREYSWREK